MGQSAPSAVDVCVLLATYRRPDLLRQTLESLARQNLSGLTMTVVVVDNAGEAATRAAVEAFSTQLHVVYVAEAVKRGKSAALNTAFESLPNCELLVLTDDDIVADENWISALWSATTRWPQASIFGGRILPRYPADTGGINLESPWVRVALAVQDDDGAERQVSYGKLWGANLAIRARAIGGTRFNEKLGPAGSDYTSGCEVDFTRRLEAAGATCVFVPTAIVGHVVRPEQLTEKWLYARSFKQGRGEAASNSAAGQRLLFGVPRWILRQRLECLLKEIRARLAGNRASLLDVKMEREFLRGLIRQYRNQRLQGSGSPQSTEGSRT
jgi:GT2 family glycosyltransferase